MKRLLLHIIVIILVLPVGRLYAQTVAIPDPNFREYLFNNFPSAMDSNKELILANAHSITSIYCPGLNITSLEGVQYLYNLTYLGCMKNNLTSLPNISQLTKLIDLHCYENQLTSLPSLSTLVNLEYLLCYRNELSVLPDLNGLTKLKMLLCFENKLNSLPEFSTNVLLNEINAGDNQLLTLPSLSPLVNLKVLQLYDNQITEIPGVGNLLSLESINIGGNKLKAFPHFNSQSNITSIYIYRNELTSVPDLSSFTKLEQLHCYHNYISSIGKMPASLKELWFGTNNMNEVPDISLSKGLTVLRGYSNNITFIPDLSGYKSLVDINFGTNKLPSVPNSIATMTWLKILILDNNLLSNIPDLSGLTSLENCKLSGNQLSFESLYPSLANPHSGSWEILPQTPVSVPLSYTLIEGQKGIIDLKAEHNIPDLTFSWYHHGILKEQGSKPILEISLVDKSDSGTYHCTITSGNALMSSLSVTRPFTVHIRPDFNVEKDLSLTPNGDGKNDEMYFEERGQLKVYDSSGKLLDQQYAPCYWNGRTQSGKELTTGNYIITIGKDVMYNVTIIR